MVQDLVEMHTEACDIEPDVKLYITEEEAEAICLIFDQYIHTDSGTYPIE